MVEGIDPIRDEIVALLPRLRRFALSLARNVHDADDLIQSAVVRVLSRGMPAGENVRLESWMYTIVRNLWIDESRKRKVRGIAEPVDSLFDVPGEDGRVVTENRSELDTVRRAFEKLSPELRSAAVLVILNELSYREAAEILGIPIGTVMSRVARTRRAMLDAVQPKPAREGASL